MSALSRCLYRFFSFIYRLIYLVFLSGDSFCAKFSVTTKVQMLLKTLEAGAEMRGYLAGVVGVKLLASLVLTQHAQNPLNGP